MRNVLLLVVGAAGWIASFNAPNTGLCVALALPSGFAVGLALRSALRALQEDE